MKITMKAVALLLAAVVGGYLVIAVLQTLVLEVALGGAVGVQSPLGVLVLATVGTVASGLIGGFLVARVDRAHPLRHVAGVLCALAFDAVFVITNTVGADPVWFSLSGALTLMAATGLGGWIGARPSY